MRMIVMALAVFVAMPAMAGDSIFKEVPQNELDEISRSLDLHCRTYAQRFAVLWAFPKGHPGGEICELGHPSREEMEATIFDICREATDFSALQYGAAVNLARRAVKRQ